MSIPVRLGVGQIISPHLVQLVVHGLPARLCRQGMGQAILTAAGYSSQECSVAGEFLGDLPARFSGCSAAGEVGNSDACLIYVKATAADRRLAQMPRYFRVGQEQVYISKPGQLKQPPPTQPSQQPHSQPATTALPPVAGPRAIRVRQRTAAAARTSHSFATQLCSSQLQALETHVRNSRTPGADRRGLGSAEPSQQPHTIGPFVPAVDTQPPVPMDCQPPSSAEVLPPVTQATAMDVDAAPQPPSPSPSAMDCDTQDSQLPCHQAASSLETQLAGVSMDLIDTCFEWLSVHTHHSVPAIRAAVLHLYAAAPTFLRGSPSEAAVCKRLQAILDQQDGDCGSHRGGPQPATPAPVPTQGPDPAPVPAPAPRPSQLRRTSHSTPARPARPAHRPQVPPGFELQAAQMAAAMALNGLTAPRRSTRSRTQPRAWWTSPQQHGIHSHSRGPSAMGRRPCQP